MVAGVVVADIVAGTIIGRGGLVVAGLAVPVVLGPLRSGAARVVGVLGLVSVRSTSTVPAVPVVLVVAAAGVAVLIELLLFGVAAIT